MLRKLSAAFIVCVYFAAAGVAAVRAASFDDIYTAVNEGISAERAYEYVGRIWQYDKWCTFPMWEKSAAEVQMIMRERAFDEALVIEEPADGVTKHGDWTSPIGWDCKQATLEVIEPAGLPEELRYLCNYRVSPSCLTFFSNPTSPEGLEAELVILEKSDPETLAKLDVRGKIILVSGRAGYMKKFLKQNGALGILSDQPVGPHDDASVWLNTWSDHPGGWLMLGNDSRHGFCFSTSAAKGRRLRHLIARGETVKLRVTIDSRYYTDGVLPYVVGSVRGTGDQEVLIGGHLFEWGANDNATGCAIMLESVGTLNDLIRSGVLPRPKRTVRVWMGHEMYGSLPFAERYLSNLRRTVAAVCCDTPAPDRDLNASTVKVFMHPTMCPTYADALYPEFWRRYYSRMRLNKPIIIEPFEGGTDTYFCEPLIGAPTTFVYMENGTWLHHTSLDTIDKVDKRSLRDLCMVNALYLYYMADAGNTELEEIAGLTFDHGTQVILDKTREMKAKAVAASGGASLGRILAEGIESIEYHAGLQQQALSSIERLLADEHKADARGKIKRLNDDIGDFGKLCAAQFKGFVEAIAKDHGIKIVKYRPSKTAVGGEKLYPKATRLGTLTFEGIPTEEWNGVWGSQRWFSERNIQCAAYWWADGTNTVPEIARRVRLGAERSVDNFDFVSYFRFLEKHGYVEFVR